MVDFLKNVGRWIFCLFQQTKFQCAGQTDIGKVRKKNEDAFHFMEDKGIFIVADGMGGHNAGEIASRVAIETMVRFFSKKWCQVFKNPEEVRHSLITSFRIANDKVIKVAATDHDLRGMGCTLVACMIENKKLHTCHVGDARCYLAAGGEMKQITNDHTVAANYATDTLNSDTVSTLVPTRHVVTRAIGFPFPEDPEYHCEELPPEAKLLLCSDGLWSMIDDAKMHQVLKESPTPQNAVDSLVDMANAAGGLDNITALVVFS